MKYSLKQLNLNTGHPYSLSFFLFVTHHRNTYSSKTKNLVIPLIYEKTPCKIAVKTCDAPLRQNRKDKE